MFKGDSNEPIWKKSVDIVTLIRYTTGTVRNCESGRAAHSREAALQRGSGRLFVCLLGRMVNAEEEGDDAGRGEEAAAEEAVQARLVEGEGAGVPGGAWRDLQRQRGMPHQRAADDGRLSPAQDGR